MRKILSIIVAAAMVTTCLVTSLAAEETKKDSIVFSDVNENTPGAEAIYKLVDAGIIHGYADGTFKPNNSLKRSELATMMNLVFRYTEPAEENFWDVTKDNWYYEQVLIAKKAGYIAGFEDGSFKGESPLTREQVCAFVNRCAELMLLDANIQITDKISDWAKDDVMKVVSNQFMPLEENNTFRATENITRTELAQVLCYFVIDEEIKPTVKPTATQKPTTGGSTGGSGENGNSKPTTSPSATAKPTTSPSATAKPTTSPSATAKPTTSPSATVKPTTSPSATVKPTTSPSATAKPTTSPSATVKPTTSPSATVKPTTSPSATVKPTPTPTLEVFDNTEVVSCLKATLEQVWKPGVRYTSGEREVLKPVKEAIEDALANADEVKLSKKYIKTQYQSQINEAKSNLSALDEGAQSAFINKIVGLLDDKTFDFLMEYFLTGEDIGL